MTFDRFRVLRVPVSREHVAQLLRERTVSILSYSYTPEQKSIPFARVNHNKYMVTDNGGYIGTSNWSGDYFNGTAGVSVTIRQDGDSSLPQQLRDVFSRDWNSKYAKPIKCHDQPIDWIRIVSYYDNTISVCVFVSISYIYKYTMCTYTYVFVSCLY